MATTKTTTAAPKKDLFKTAAKTTKVAKKPSKEAIEVEPAIAIAIDRFVAAKKKEAEVKSELAENDAIIKGAGKKIFIADMEESGKRKESFILASKTQGVLYIVQDGYKTSDLDEERITYMKETYGEDIIETKTTYLFNEEMVEKYGELISKAILGIKGIPDAEKELIITAQEKNTLAKGTVDKLRDIAKENNTTVAAVFEDVCPTQQLRVRGTGK